MKLTKIIFTILISLALAFLISCLLDLEWVQLRAIRVVIVNAMVVSVLIVGFLVARQLLKD